MNRVETVKLILEGIEDAKQRAKMAMAQGNKNKAHELIGDLYALERCLVIESQKLIDQLEEEIAA